MRTAIAACALLVLFAVAPAEAHLAALIKTDGAKVYAHPDDSTAVLAELRSGFPVGFDGMSIGMFPEWRRVEFRRDVRTAYIRGWIKARDLWPSDGLWLAMRGRHEEAAARLASEATGVRDAKVLGWLLSMRAQVLWKNKQVDSAVVAFIDVIGVADTDFTPLAYLALARIYLERDSLNEVVSTYEALMKAAPDYAVDQAACEANPSVIQTQMCSGNPSIRVRLDATRRLQSTRTELRRQIDDPAASSLTRARAWLSLARALEEKSDIDPGRNIYGRIAPNDARAAYETAIHEAPESDIAGDAAWRLIDFARPYEWEGDIEFRADWTFKHFGAFLAAYPRHPQAGEAQYEVAMATWARGGYPEAFSIIKLKGTWADWRVRQEHLDAWFDTSRFGGSIVEAAPLPNPKEAERVLAMFRDLVATYPSSPSAIPAKYYIAVILDYCLAEKSNALREYEAFFLAHPGGTILADKARKRIAVLRAGSR